MTEKKYFWREFWWFMMLRWFQTFLFWFMHFMWISKYFTNFLPPPPNSVGQKSFYIPVTPLSARIAFQKSRTFLLPSAECRMHFSGGRESWWQSYELKLVNGIIYNIAPNCRQFKSPPPIRIVKVTADPVTEALMPLYGPDSLIMLIIWPSRDVAVSLVTRPDRH